MLEKVNKISVLNKMIGFGEEVQSSYIVPQNSTDNFRHKIDGVGEIKPIENSLDAKKMSSSNCRHCENMAKNFLYLESLIRTNTASNPQHCKICDASLNYLQYVNKGILGVFGNFDGIARSAKAFSESSKEWKTKSKAFSKASKEWKTKLQSKSQVKSEFDKSGHSILKNKSLKRKSTFAKNRSSLTESNKSKQQIDKSNFSLEGAHIRKPLGKLKQRKLNLKGLYSQDSTISRKSLKTKKRNALRKFKIKKLNH